MSVHAQLCFGSIRFDYAVEGINPRLVCPSCKHPFEPKTKPVSVLPDSFDFNKQVVFLCPSCGAKISLFAAVHKELGEEPMLCIQRSDVEGVNGIPVDWWKKSGST